MAEMEFEVGDVIMEIGGSVRHLVVNVTCDWYDTVPDSPILCLPWIMKDDAHSNYVKVE